jgi:hypothetical protein
MSINEFCTEKEFDSIKSKEKTNGNKTYEKDIECYR